MKEIEDKEFIGETVDLDGIAFIRCRFIGCHLVFYGRDVFRMDKPRMENCTAGFEGSALLTLRALDAMYRHGGTLAAWVDKTFEMVRAGTIMKAH